MQKLDQQEIRANYKVSILTNNTIHIIKITMFFTRRNRVAVSHFVAVSITIGINTIIVVMLNAARNPSRGNICGIAIANIAANT